MTREEAIRRIKEAVARLGSTAYENYTHDNSDKEYWTYMTCKRITDFINTLIPERSENDMRLCNLIAKCIALGKQKGLVNDDDEIACLDILKRKDRSLSKYDKDMLKIIIGELEQEAQDVNVPGMYEFEINWLKSFFGL